MGGIDVRHFEGLWEIFRFKLPVGRELSQSVAQLECHHIIYFLVRFEQLEG